MQIIFLFIILLSMAVVCALATLVRSNYPFEQYVLHQKAGAEAWMKFPFDILTFIILLNNLIPMSLIVTMEFVKFMLGTLINSDLDMYHEESDTPATARTSSLVEELGQVDYIFSDKTGTLTCNVMDFRMSSVAGRGFAQVVSDDKKLRRDENGNEVGYHDFDALKRFFDTDMTQQGDVLREFFTLLAVCHTVIPEVDEDDPSAEIVYQASSPDEAALVKGARAMGYVFTVFCSSYRLASQRVS